MSERRRPLPPRAGPARSAPQTAGKRALPVFDTTAEAKHFLATANLDDYDLSPVDAAFAAAPPPRPEATRAPEAAPAPRTPPSRDYRIGPPRPRPQDGARPSHQPCHEYAHKTARLTMRLPEALLHAIKAEARLHGLPYQRLIRETLERAVAGRGSG